MTNDRAALNAAVNHIANLELASPARFEELRKTMNGNADVLSRQMNHHRQELDASREEVVRLSQELEELRADKVILEARVDSMAERLCRCSETSPRVRGIGSAAEPLELEDEELEYVIPPMTSSPAEEEVPSLTKGPPCFKRILAFDSWHLAGSSLSSSNPLMESSAEEERLREAPLPGLVRGQRAIRGKWFRPYSYRKALGHLPVDTRHLGVEREQRRNERRLRRESAAFSGYAASSSDDGFGTTDRSCRGSPDDPEVGSS